MRKKALTAYADIKGPDHIALLCSLSRAFAVCSENILEHIDKDWFHFWSELQADFV